jgi:hypothetical protein
MSHHCRLTRAALSTLAILVVAHSTTATARVPAKRQRAKILFVLDATGGTAGAQDASGAFALTITGVDPNVLWFTDRPARDTGLMSVQRMLKMLAGSDGGAAPNIVVEADAGERGPQAVALELDDLRYDAGTATLQARARSLKTVGGQRLRHYRRRLATTLDPAFGRAAIFVDSAPFGSTNFCGVNVVNSTGVPVTLSDQFKWDSDTWDPAPPGNGYVLSPPQSVGWQSDGGFARGCGNSTTWVEDQGTTFHVSVTDPYGDSPNSISCTSSDPEGHPCHVDTGSTTRGPDINVTFYFCDLGYVSSCPGQ